MPNTEKQKILNDLGGLSEEIYDDLVRELLALSEKNIVIIKTALEGNDFEQIGKTAHLIKGASANLRIYKIQELTKTMEMEAKGNKDKQIIHTALKELEETLKEIKA